MFRPSRLLPLGTVRQQYGGGSLTSALTGRTAGSSPSREDPLDQVAFALCPGALRAAHRTVGHDR
ncbi:hypothetical protein GCM10010259_61190 [Streptomyces daghestanicus]|uniref:Uncharacterized protein n=1 Tax=Streptomyces daghestanicus TaxID=66885 RepID=A0ABQ3Q7P0_9ACTN|nr:hypothetical protein GCM10010259_61190 [Streptomyces daghestanicus]GHI33274.1 hypothetical protein Sdagh_50040 [Streptomyces daghestanicus]